MLLAKLFCIKSKRMVYKCKNLEWMAENRRIPIRGGIWIDAYNKITNKVAGTIKARIDHNNLYFVTELNVISSNKDKE